MLAATCSAHDVDTQLFIFQIDIIYDNLGLTPDDYGSCALQLICTDLNLTGKTATVTSSVNEVLADWMSEVTCPVNYFLVAFKMKSESPIGSSDDIAVGDFNFRCRGPGLDGTSYTDLAGAGLDRGSWGAWSDECPPGSAICAIQTSVEDMTNEDDCTAINDAEFICCDY